MTFFDTYSFRQKNIALAVMSVLLIAVTYKKAFSVSIKTKEYRDELVLKLAKAKHADQDIRSNQVLIAKLNLFLGEENNTIEKVQQGFLNFFAENGHGITVNEIDEVMNYKHPDFEINTHRIMVRGNFKNTLTFIYNMEKEFTLAKILNLEFEFKRNSMDEDKALFTTLLIQNFLK